METTITANLTIKGIEYQVVVKEAGAEYAAKSMGEAISQLRKDSVPRPYSWVDSTGRLYCKTCGQQLT